MGEQPTPTTEAKKSILEIARCLVDAGWTKGLGARNKEGKGCSVYNSEATCFCATGAMSKACNEYLHSLDDTGSLFWTSREQFEDAVCSELYKFIPGKDGITSEWLTVTDWNDEGARTKEEVISVFDKAISYLGKGKN